MLGSSVFDEYACSDGVNIGIEENGFKKPLANRGSTAWIATNNTFIVIKKKIKKIKK